MFLGACLDLGVPPEVIERAVAELALPGIAIDVRRARRGGMAGTRFRVLEHGRPIDGPDPEERQDEEEAHLGKGSVADRVAEVGHPRETEGGREAHLGKDGIADRVAGLGHSRETEGGKEAHLGKDELADRVAEVGHSREAAGGEEAHLGNSGAGRVLRAKARNGAAGEEGVSSLTSPTSSAPANGDLARAAKLAAVPPTSPESAGGSDDLAGNPSHHHSHPHDHEHEAEEHHPPHGHDPEHRHAHGRHLSEIVRLLEGSGLEPAVKRRAIGLFRRLGEAEARVHGMEIEQVHFHEVGAVDALVDLVGAAAAIEWLAPAKITCGPVNLGSGHVHGAHGTMPVPPPAVAELVRGIPVYQSPGGELLTPTGAVLLAELVDEFRAMPTLVVSGVGYGLGRKELAGRSNAVRLTAGRPWSDGEPAEVTVVECEVDDLPAEGFGFALERLLAAGALDVYFTAVQMKKNRPGTLVTMLARPAEVERLAGILLAETGSLGCRFRTAGRFEAERTIDTVATPFGEVRIKRARFAGRELAASPEFEDCRRLALAHGVPWRDVHRAALISAGVEETPAR
ncbi:MAG: nickel pincer cofactor biosynthesis protein LarC [Thermoanaerobaculia bacterium]